MKKFTRLVPIKEGILTAFIANSFKTYLFGFINNAAISLGTTAGIVIGATAVISIYRRLMELFSKGTTVTNIVFVRIYKVTEHEAPLQSTLSQLKNIKVENKEALASVVDAIKKSKEKVIVRSDDGEQFYVQSFSTDSFKKIESSFNSSNIKYSVVKTIDVVKEFKKNGNYKLPPILHEDNLLEFENAFLKRKKPLTTIANFRKKQQGKGVWKKHRLKTHMAIKKWHKSLAGRRFHRKLDRYNMTHINRPKNTSLLRYYRNESLNLIEILREVVND